MITHIKCLIIDGNDIDRLMIIHHLKRYENIVVIAALPSAEQAFPYITTPIDLIILDADLPGMNGIEFRKLIPHIPACIYISAHYEFAIDSYELNTLDFLTKPIKQERFLLSMRKLFDFFENKEKCESFDALIGENCLQVKEGGSIFQIKISDIIYLEALKDYTRIITSEKKHCILNSLGKVLLKKCFNSFIRIHRSYAVPKHLIRRVKSNEVELIENTKLPIGRAYKSNLSFFNP